MSARHRVLLVDDEPAVLTALQLAFEDDDAAFCVTTAATAEEALTLASRDVVDLVITDKNLPGDSGLDLVRALRAAGRTMPIILMTGYGSSASRDEGRVLGLAAYVEKPFADIYYVPRLAADVLGGKCLES